MEAGLTDLRIYTVLQEARNGPITPTQDLAGHQYVRERWTQALIAHNDPTNTSAAAYGYGVLAAAVDAHRLGHHTPIPRKLLQHAAPGYLTPHQMAAAPKQWFTKAINYATHPYRGHQPLQPHPGPKAGRPYAYTPTDPLQIWAEPDLMDRLVPAHTWIGLRDYRDRSTSRLVAAEASMRWLDTLTISFLEDLMDEESRSTVNTILLRRRDIHSLAARALSGDDQAARFAAALQAVPLQDPVLMLLDFKSRSQINVREEHESYASRRADYLRLAYESWEQAAVRAVSDLRSAEMLELAHHINGLIAIDGVVRA